MKEYLDEEMLAKKQAVQQMIELMETRYKCCCNPLKGSKYFVITSDGMDGVDIHSNGDYEYDYHKKVNFRKQTKEEIIKILDEYFEISQN